MREHIIEIVGRTLNCGNIEKGYIKHKCIECNEEYSHGFTCKSKFCSKCGRKYYLEWSDKQVNNMLNVTHRRAVLELRNYFYQKCELLKDLQDAVYGVVSNYYENKKPKKKITVTIDVLEFIGKITQHIHPKGFRVVRRYGLYSSVKNKLSIEICSF